VIGHAGAALLRELADRLGLTTALGWHQVGAGSAYCCQEPKECAASTRPFRIMPPGISVSKLWTIGLEPFRPYRVGIELDVGKIGLFKLRPMKIGPMQLGIA
jgi:hypothetical protein